jgi:hypothetical protein
MMKSISVLSFLLFLLAGLLVTGLFIKLGFHAYPSADDFCMAAGVQREGLWPHLWNHYQGWSGRYSGNALYAIFPLVFGMYDGFFLLPLLTIMGLYGAADFFLSRLFRLPFYSLSILLMSLCFVAIFLLGMKHTASSVYWLAGALTYQTGNILLLVALGMMIVIHDRQLQQRPYRLLSLGLVAVIFIAVGSNEVSMLMLSGLLLLIYGLQRRLAAQHATVWKWFVLIAAAGFVIVYFAPGNAVREATFPLRHQWQRSIDGSVEMGLWIVQSWLFNPLMIVTLLLTPFAVSWLAQYSPRSFRVETKMLWLLGGITLVVPFVLQFPAWWAMGGWPPPRTVDAIYFVFLLSLLMFVGALTLRFTPRLYRKINHWALPAGALLFAGAIAIHPQMQRAWLDMNQRVEPYQVYMQDRLKRIEQAREQQTYFLKLPGFEGEYPRSIYFNDIVPSARDWRNVCYAQYHGLQWVARAAQKRQRQSPAVVPPRH